MLQTMMEMTRSQGAITEAIKGLQVSIERLTVKIDKIDDLRVSVAKLETSMSTTSAELETAKTKLDSVRKWVIGAAAVTMVAGASIPIVLRFWSLPVSAPAASVAAPSNVVK